MLSLEAPIYVAGHTGMVGSAIVRQLQAQGYANIITRTHAELDLTDQAAVRAFFAQEKPAQVYLAAARVGGIHANNTYPAEFIYQNLMIEANVIDAAYRNGVQKLLFLGSTCIYPKAVPQPMEEHALLTGTLEPTNEPYAIAKIAGIKLCESYNRQYGTDYRSVMPTNLYGPGDNYHLARLAMEGDIAGIIANEEKYGEIPSDIKTMIGLDPAAPITPESRLTPKGEVILWGTGKAYREFLHVDDMAAASVFVMNLDKATYDANTEPMCSHINVGYGSDLTIRETAEIVAETVGYEGKLVFDTTKPDGTPKKLVDSTRLNALGWHAENDITTGINKTFHFYADTQMK